MASKKRAETKIHFVHSSRTHARQDIGKRTINKWHLKEGIYSDSGLTGYHHVLRRSGLLELARYLPVMGQHVLGWNEISIGTCLVGGARKPKVGETAEADGFVGTNNFTVAQLNGLATLHRSLLLSYPTLILAPHNAVSMKGCPGFDLWAWQQAVFGQNDSLRFAEFLEQRNREAEDAETSDQV